MARLATVYRKNTGSLEKQARPDYANLKYFSGAGGLLSSTEDYLQYAQMLLNGGHVPDTLPGRPKGRGFGLSVQVVSDAVAANLRVSDGSYGWDGAFGTHFWIDPKEKIVGILMVQTPNQEVSRDFENAVMQAVVE